ncbi:hypothetical protein XENTR_v10018526 [Xenopus tropicalis]|nr:hypothetical protein XENTR_v10018526 [Xenopus tropicalis]
MHIHIHMYFFPPQTLVYRTQPREVPLTIFTTHFRSSEKFCIPIMSMICSPFLDYFRVLSFNYYRAH